MEENSTQTLQFNIHGPVQILPKAIKAEQHFYGDQLAREVLRQRATNDCSYTEEENRLAIYIHKEEALKTMLTQLDACSSAKQVGKVVVKYVMANVGISEKDMVTAEFIETLLPLTPKVTSGKSVDNYRKAINEALADRPRKA